MTKSKATHGGQNRFMRILRLPIRALSHARDLYVRSMTDYADRVGYGNMGVAGGQYPALPRSFSSARSGEIENDDLGQLIRAVSATRFGDRIDVDAILGKQQYCRSSTVRQSKVVAQPKSRSVRLDRIDEEEDADDDSMKKGNGGLSSFFPRSRSCVLFRYKNSLGD